MLYDWRIVWIHSSLCNLIVLKGKAVLRCPRRKNVQFPLLKKRPTQQIMMDILYHVAQLHHNESSAKRRKISSLYMFTTQAKVWIFSRRCFGPMFCVSFSSRVCTILSNLSPKILWSVDMWTGRFNHLLLVTVSIVGQTYAPDWVLFNCRPDDPASIIHFYT